MSLPRVIGFTLLALALPASASAQSWTAGWAGEASLTGSRTTGNTNTSDIGLGLKLRNEDGLWRHKFKARFDYGRASGSTNKQRIGLGYQLDRDIGDRVYLFANADYFEDDFGPFRENWFLGTGVGYDVLIGEFSGEGEPATGRRWKVQGGTGYRSQTAAHGNVLPAGVDSLTNTGLALSAASDFDWTLNAAVSLYNDTELLSFSTDTYVWNEVGLTATLFGDLAARASFRVDHHTDVPLGREKTDTISRVGIVYTMK